MTRAPDYRLTSDAQSDLIDIRHYTVKQWGPNQSRKYLSELRKTILALSETPTIGKKRLEVGEEVFSFPHVSHVIYYTLDNQKLVVFGVLHKSMVPLLHLDDRSTN
jgi:toxin ParE1/3/4